MKRLRSETACEVEWITSNGRVKKLFDVNFLKESSDFFGGYFRMHGHQEKFAITVGYPKKIIEFLFLHMYGDTLSLTSIQEFHLNSLIDYLGLKSPLDKLQKRTIYKTCQWCGSTETSENSSVCKGKRFFVYAGDMKCALCLEHVTFCPCNHQNSHCFDETEVQKFKFPRRQLRVHL